MSDSVNRSYSLWKRAIVPILLIGAICFSLYINVRSIFTFPAPNSWIYWDGDETQAMVECQSQVTKLLYAYPNAAGSLFQHGSGILKGSVWITSLIYGGAASLIRANPVDIGRTVSFILACMLLIGIYRILRKQNTSPAIALTAILAFTTTDGFLIMSHSARPDMLIALADLFIIAALIRFRNRGNKDDRQVGLILGLLIIGGLLVSIHVWIDCGLTIIYLLWRTGMLKRFRVWKFTAIVVIAGFSIISLLYFLRTGRFDLFGPFGYLPPPLQHFFSPGAQRGNLLYRWFILTEWSPAYIPVGIILLTGVLILKLRGKHLDRVMELWFFSTFLLLCSLAYLEAMLPRYYIYALPLVTISFALSAQAILNSIAHPVFRRACSVLGLSMIVFFAFRFTTTMLERQPFANEIAQKNKNAVLDAVSMIERDSSHGQSVIASNSVLYALMDVPNIRPICELFISAPDVALKSEKGIPLPKADYLLTISSARVLDVSGVNRIPSPMFGSHWNLIMQRTGVFSDIGRSYSKDGMKDDDTLRLYRVIP